MPRGDNGQITDDYDGQPLPADTPQTHLSLGSTTYLMYLSEDNQHKLVEVLQPFISNAEGDDRTGRMHNMR